MKKTVFVAGVAIAFAGQASALSLSNSQPYVMDYAEFQTVGAIASWLVPVTDGAAVLPTDQLARRGQPEPGDDRGNHGAGHAMNELLVPLFPEDLSRRGRGRDDAPGDDHGNHGAGHAMNELLVPLFPEDLSRRGRGRDDAPGDDHGVHGAGHAMNELLVPLFPEDLSRRGRGRDDAPGDDHGNHGAGHA